MFNAVMAIGRFNCPDRNGIKMRYYVHRLVALTFSEHRPRAIMLSITKI